MSEEKHTHRFTGWERYGNRDMAAVGREVDRRVCLDCGHREEREVSGIGRAIAQESSQTGERKRR